MQELDKIQISLLQEGYLRIQDAGDFQLYVDTVGGGLDILYQPKTKALYVCGKGGQLRIFPITEPAVAIKRSRELASRGDRTDWGTFCTD